MYALIPLSEAHHTTTWEITAAFECCRETTIVPSLYCFFEYQSDGGRRGALCFNERAYICIERFKRRAGTTH